MTKERLNPSNLKDYTERTWFLGTDILDEGKDLTLMYNGVSASFTREEGAIYSTSQMAILQCKKMGYTDYFIEVLEEAKKINYDFVLFDRDIISEVK